MCDCFHLAFPNWHAASSGTGGHHTPVSLLFSSLLLLLSVLFRQHSAGVQRRWRAAGEMMLVCVFLSDGGLVVLLMLSLSALADLQ